MPTFVIPAGKKGHTETLRHTLGKAGAPSPDIRLLGLGTHMHYVGTDMTIQLDRASTKNGDPQQECLLGTPRWSFDWQRLYMIDQPIESLPQVHLGDVVTMKCTYDNSMGNPFVVEALAEQGLAAPKDVVLGETTLDEMCLGVFMTLFPM